MAKITRKTTQTSTEEIQENLSKSSSASVENQEKISQTGSQASGQTSGGSTAQNDGGGGGTSGGESTQTPINSKPNTSSTSPNPSPAGSTAKPNQGVNTNSPTTPTPGAMPSKPMSPLSDGQEEQPGGQVSGEQEEEKPEGEEKEDEEEKEEEEEEKDEDEDEDKDEEDENEKDEPKEEGEPKEGEETPEPVKPEGNDISPSLNDDDLKNKFNLKDSAANAGKKNADAVLHGEKGVGEAAVDTGKEVAKDAGKKVAKEAAKKAAQAALQAIRTALSTAATELVALFGWPVLAVCCAIFLVIMLIFLGLACSAANGNFGKTYPKLAGAKSIIVKDINKLNQNAAKGVGDTTNGGDFKQLDFLDSSDQKYINEGKIDERLLEALKYLSEKHYRIAVSHLLSGYITMPAGEKDPESGNLRDPKLVNNVSAHKDGLAGDVNQIDFVIKSIEPSKVCTGDDPKNDIVYYADGSSNESSVKANVPNGSEIGTGDMFSYLGDSVNDLLAELNKINVDININPQEAYKVGNTKNTVSDLRDKLKANSDKINQYAKTIDITRPKIIIFRDKINNSSLSDELKAKYNASLDDTAAKLDASSKNMDSLNNVASELQAQMTQITLDQQGQIESINKDTAILNQQIDQLNKNLEKFTGLQKISQIHGIEGLNNYLNDINASFDKVTEGLNANLNNIDVPSFDSISNGLFDSLGGFGGFFGSGDELLRLYCEGGQATGITTKEAIPIKVSWQDTKPNIAHASNEADDSITEDSRIFYSVYQPQARLKVHQVIAELLQFPYDKKDSNYFKVTQLITFSEERDVTPFSAILDKLYGKQRPANYGLFNMPESWSQVHIAY